MSAALPGAGRHLFTYGSLMFAPVWRQVVRRRYRSAAARVDGHARYIVIGEDYPGMIAQAENHVDGVVYFDIEPADLAALDRFEGAEYRRASVVLEIDGRQVRADTYLYIDAAGLSAQPWRPEDFPLQHFIQRHCRNA
jgi:gamma-glutamylcyclotransferase (GGCT)/AIG2-like uncharacterized protein YtfP